MRPRLDGAIAGRLKAIRRDDETLADAIDRVIDGDLDGVSPGGHFETDIDPVDADETRPRIPDAVADRLRDLQRPDETVSEALGRLMLAPSVAALADRLGRTPSSRDLEADEHTPRLSEIIDVFGKWNAALEAADLDPRYHQSGPFTDDELIDDLLAFADELGETPTSPEMVAHGPHSTSTYIERFGSWTDALEAAGLKKGGLECPGCARAFDGAGELREHIDGCDDAKAEAVA